MGILKKMEKKEKVAKKVEVAEAKTVVNTAVDGSITVIADQVVMKFSNGKAEIDISQLPASAKADIQNKFKEGCQTSYKF